MASAGPMRCTRGYPSRQRPVRVMAAEGVMDRRGARSRRGRPGHRLRGQSPQQGEGVNVVVGVSLKTYFGYHQTLEWARAFADLFPRGSRRDVEMFVLPSFPTLPEVTRVLAGTGIAVGAQDLSADDAGNRTGEVTGALLAEIGCRYAETGHAERCTLFGVTDSVVAAK